MEKVLVIAEAGVNHNGDLELAKRLVDVAVECGADVVKFQTAKLNSLVSKHASMAEYQKNNIGKETSQKEMLEKLILDFPVFEILAEYCKEKGIEFLSTPFDIESILFLNPLVRFWKVPSGEITNYPYLCEIGKTQKDVVMSTGMATVEEIKAAIEVLRTNGTKKITLLHCTTEYPAPIEEINLNAIQTLRQEFKCEVGYSDHSEGNEISLAAVALGATVIEKHFTLDKNMEGPDHKASVTPEELRTLVSGIRKLEVALGNGIKAPGETEKKNISVARKSIVAKTDIKKGEIFTVDNITTKRPGNGISPMHWNEVLGNRAERDFGEDELIEL